MDSAFFAMAALLVTATWLDFKNQTIPNWLTFGGTIVGLAFNAANTDLPYNGIAWSLSGMIVGLSVFLPFYVMKITGAGDVKLLAMVGTFLGPLGVLWAAVLTVIAGGILGVIWIVYKVGPSSLFYKMVGSVATSQVNKVTGEIGTTLDTEIAQVMKSKMPYGCAIAVGAISSYLKF